MTIGGRAFSSLGIKQPFSSQPMPKCPDAADEEVELDVNDDDDGTVVRLPRFDSKELLVYLPTFSDE